MFLIHNVVLIDKLDGNVVARTRFWKVDFIDTDITEFLSGYRDLQTTDGLAGDTPVFVNQHKVFHGEVGEELLLMFVTDGRDEDRYIKQKVRNGVLLKHGGINRSDPEHMNKIYKPVFQCQARHAEKRVT